MNHARAILCCSAVLFGSIASAQTLLPSSSSRRSTSPLAEPVASRTNRESPNLARPYLRGSGSLKGSLGFTPGLIFGGGLDHRFSRVLLLSDASIDTARKVGLSGFSLHAGAGLYAMKKHFGMGGGARCGKLATSTYEKSSCRPFVGGVYNSQKLHFDAGYYFPGSDKLNRLQGVRTMTVLPMSKRMAFEFEFGLYRFVSGSKMHTGIVSNPGMRYIF